MKQAQQPSRKKHAPVHSFPCLLLARGRPEEVRANAWKWQDGVFSGCARDTVYLRAQTPNAARACDRLHDRKFRRNSKHPGEKKHDGSRNHIPLMKSPEPEIFVSALQAGLVKMGDV
jgi:hypothetical protein